LPYSPVTKAELEVIEINFGNKKFPKLKTCF